MLACLTLTTNAVETTVGPSRRHRAFPLAEFTAFALFALFAL